MKRLAIVLLLITPVVLGSEKKADSTWSHRKVAPTWLHRYVPDLPEKKIDISTGSCHDKPIFGAGDSAARIVRSVARYGEVTVDPNGACKDTAYPREEQIYFILEGAGLFEYGGQKVSVKEDDFMYIPPGIKHGISNPSGKSCRLVIMGFTIPQGTAIPSASRLQSASMQTVREQTDVGHPKSVLYRLLLGNRKGTHDKIDSGIVVTSLFLMDFAPGGTNFPHRHEIAEEIYLVLDGHGLMAAGGGMDGIEGLHPAKAGDAYFFRPNCTVGFYNSQRGKAHILAVRSWVPVPQRDYEN
jgi:mannose-6-phosphate isomerase-like protein (cupin superfamily)